MKTLTSFIFFVIIVNLFLLRKGIRKSKENCKEEKLLSKENCKEEKLLESHAFIFLLYFLSSTFSYMLCWFPRRGFHQWMVISSRSFSSNYYILSLGLWHPLFSLFTIFYSSPDLSNDFPFITLTSLAFSYRNSSIL